MTFALLGQRIGAVLHVTPQISAVGIAPQLFSLEAGPLLPHPWLSYALTILTMANTLYALVSLFFFFFF